MVRIYEQSSAAVFGDVSEDDDMPTLQIFDTVMVTEFFCVLVSKVFPFTHYREFPYGNSL